MLTDDEFDGACFLWLDMGPRERDEARLVLDKARAAALRAEPFESRLSEEFRTQSREAALELVDWNELAPEFAGAECAVEMAILAKLFSCPRVRAWEKAARYIKAGLTDPEFEDFPELQTLFKTAMEAINETGAIDWADVNELLVTSAVEKTLNSRRARANAQAKNSEPKAWVREQWESRPDKQQGKAAFSRQHAPLVKKKFQLNVNADTISRDWLPKAKT